MWTPSRSDHWPSTCEVNRTTGRAISNIALVMALIYIIVSIRIGGIQGLK